MNGQTAIDLGETLERAHTVRVTVCFTASDGKAVLNTREEIQKAIAIGVDSYFTNYTAEALELEKALRKA